MDNLPLYLFSQGTNYQSYRYLGAHPAGDAWVFRVYAPGARAAYVVGSFNGWEKSDPMERIGSGVWEVTLPAGRARAGDAYKFLLETVKGDLYKADPYARRAGLPPETASILCEESTFRFTDEGWMTYRSKRFSSTNVYKQPINIYEMHLGSWRRNADGSVMTYEQIAAELIPYVKAMGYTHVELLPVMEHPFDGSWGYQVTGYFAPTARYGTPDGLRAFINACHGAGIGVILDWVPAHFPKDAHGLYEFDGTPLYEYQGIDRQEHHGWGTRFFDVGRPQVQSFLISSADLWLREFHADGLRVDAVASMLYLDYDRAPGEWIPNVYGDNKNLEAIAFFKKLCGHVRGAFPDCMMIAEESGSMGGVTDPQGLGFTFKWNMGWMNDTLSYASTDTLYRNYDHEKLTFSLTYAFSEKYVLPISHDEVVHGKKSFLDRMPGTYEEKFRGARLFALYQMTHPGKKLNFMGNEIAMFAEWDENREVEWFMLDYDAHRGYQAYIGALGQFYLSHPALYERDDSWAGFRWCEPDDRANSVISFLRSSEKEELLVILNFGSADQPSYEVGVPRGGRYPTVFATEPSPEEGRCGVLAKRAPLHGLPARIRVSVPALSGKVIRCPKPKVATTAKKADKH